MKIIRRNEYIAVPVRPLRSGALSIRAKGMLMVLFSLPEGRVMTDYDLVSACRMTLEDVSEVARELERAGYLVRDDGVLRVFDAPLEDGEFECL